MITVTIWHNVAHDGEGRHIAMLDGYRPCDPMVRVFTCQANPAGRPPEEIAEEAFAICNGHPPGAHADLARRYYERELRSLSFPGSSACCRRSCCVHRRVVRLRTGVERSARRIGAALVHGTGRRDDRQGNRHRRRRAGDRRGCHDELAVMVSRYDPAAAGKLGIHRRYGTAVIVLYLADENAGTAHKPEQRSGLVP